MHAGVPPFFNIFEMFQFHFKQFALTMFQFHFKLFAIYNALPMQFNYCLCAFTWIASTDPSVASAIATVVASVASAAVSATSAVASEGCSCNRESFAASEQQRSHWLLEVEIIFG